MQTPIKFEDSASFVTEMDVHDALKHFREKFQIPKQPNAKDYSFQRQFVWATHKTSRPNFLAAFHRLQRRGVR